MVPLHLPSPVPYCTHPKAPLPEGLPSSRQERGSLLAGGKIKSLGCDIPETVQRTPGSCSCLCSLSSSRCLSSPAQLSASCGGGEGRRAWSWRRLGRYGPQSKEPDLAWCRPSEEWGVGKEQKTLHQDWQEGIKAKRAQGSRISVSGWVRKWYTDQHPWGYRLDPLLGVGGLLDHGSSCGWERRVRTSERLTHFKLSLG